MRKLTVRDARQSLSRLDKILEIEGELTITRRGEAIAKVVPIVKMKVIPSHRDLREKMPFMRKGSEKIIREDQNSR